METTSELLSRPEQAVPRHLPLHWYERVFVRLMRRTRGASLCITFPGGATRVVGDRTHPLIEMRIRHADFFRRVFAGGDVAFGETYVDGLWSSPDLSSLLELLAKNQGKLGFLRRGLSLIARQANRRFHAARRNTLPRSRENIREHYDLSNAFYRTFLDSTMSYSSASFRPGVQSETLESAQIRKIDRMLDLADVGEGSEILEIGAGWGALALRAAKRGARVKTVTLSRSQFDYAKALFLTEGVADRITIELKDYRELSGRFDAVLSCEMIEAVGREYLDTYFQVIRDALKPGAKAVLQAITIPDERYARYCGSCDWIRKHIFPGGHLPSPGAIRECVRKVGGVRVARDEAFGPDYAETLRRWRRAFNQAESQVDALGFDTRFRRKWNYYFAYCIAGFATGLINVRHIVLENKVK